MTAGAQMCQPRPVRGRPAHPQGTDRWSRSDWWGIVLDAPDPRALGRFYSELLGWAIFKESDDDVSLDIGEGVAYLAIQREANYVPPTWPARPGDQQMMLHLDFEVTDLEQSVAHALELGAQLPDVQPQEDVRVLLDPAGHPFCLYT